MDKLIIRHLSGSKVSQSEEFTIQDGKEFTFGRNPASDILYDPEKDNLISTNHAKLTRDAADPNRFILTDLNSRNGTFVEGRKITGSIPIGLDTLVQFGMNGPKWKLDMDPRPNLTPPTRFEAPISGTRMESPVGVTGEEQPIPVNAASRNENADRPSGRMTRMENALIQTQQGSQNAQRDQRLLMTVGLATVAVLLIAGIVSALFFFKKPNATTNPAGNTSIVGGGQNGTGGQAGNSGQTVSGGQPGVMLTSSEIFSKYSKAVVQIETGWDMVVDGRPVYRKFKYFRKYGAMPLYHYVGGKLEPVLTLVNPIGINQKIGTELIGSGFLVKNADGKSDGFIITNKHIATRWEVELPINSNPAKSGFLVDEYDNVTKQVIEPMDWIPGRSKLNDDLHRDTPLTGRTNYLHVVFANTKQRITAQRNSESSTNDVAIIKIALSYPPDTIETFDAYDRITAGSHVAVIGYSNPDYLLKKSDVRELSGHSSTVETIAVPTIIEGNISSIVQEKINTTTPTISTAADSYQLSITAHPGDSGAPLFDDHGRVIGIYVSFSGIGSTSTTVSHAIPIKYGLELIDQPAR